MVNTKVTLLGVVLLLVGILTAPGFASFFIGMGIPIPDLSVMLSSAVPIALPFGIAVGHIILGLGILLFAIGLYMAY